VNNYRLASIQSKLKALDEWLRNRLRYCIWSRKLSAILFIYDVLVYNSN
jgi:hypothetical protein